MGSAGQQVCVAGQLCGFDLQLLALPPESSLPQAIAKRAAAAQTSANVPCLFIAIPPLSPFSTARTSHSAIEHASARQTQKRRTRGCCGDGLNPRAQANVRVEMNHSDSRTRIADLLGLPRFVHVQRGQFDRPIGSFQAIKHLAADMYVRAEMARAAVYAGSINRVDFSEEDEKKGFVLVELQNGKSEWEFVPVKARPFLTIRSEPLTDAPTDEMFSVTRTYWFDTVTGAPINLTQEQYRVAVYEDYELVLFDGTLRFSDAEVDRIREYLLKGGFIWADDSWGDHAIASWESEIARVLPPMQYPIRDIPLDHPLFRTLFIVPKLPQIPAISHWRRWGTTSERPGESDIPVIRGISARYGNLLVLMTHNTDISDAWEREGEDPNFFYSFSPEGYAVAINVLIYTMTH